MGFGHGETLNPFLGIGTVFGFQDESLIVCKDFKCFGNVATPLFGHFHRPNGSNIQSLHCTTIFTALKRNKNALLKAIAIPNGSKSLTCSLYMSFAPERVK